MTTVQVTDELHIHQLDYGEVPEIMDDEVWNRGRYIGETCHHWLLFVNHRIFIIG